MWLCIFSIFLKQIYDQEGYCNLSVGYEPKGELVPNYFRNEWMKEDSDFLQLFEKQLKSIEKYKTEDLAYIK